MIKLTLRKLSILLVFFILLSKCWTYILFYKTNNILTNILNKNSVPSIGDINIINTRVKDIRVLSYNIFLLPNPFFCNLLDHKHSDYKTERCKLISNIIQKYDIILFQEIHPSMNFRSDLIIKNAKKYGLEYSYYSLGPTFLSQYCLSNGLLVISRYPIIETDSIGFTQSSSYDNFIEKGCIYTKVKINDIHQPIHIFNTHLQSSYDKTPKWEQIRSKQLIELKEFLSKKCNLSKDSVIIGGDFNIDFKTKEGDILIETLKPLKDTFKSGDINNTITIPYDENYIEDTRCCLICKKCKVPNNYILENQRLDYIFYSSRSNFKLKKYQILPYYTKSKKLLYKKLSDHNAVSTVFELSNSLL